MTASDMDLIAHAQSGDRRAFQQLLERHYDMIYRVAYKFSGRAEDASDIAQEVCLRLVDKLASYRGESLFSTWLYRITLNSYYDLMRKSGRQHDLVQSYTEFEKAERAEQREAAQKRAWLYRKLAELSPDMRDTALLVLSEGLSHAEAAQVMGCAESTISWRMHELRKTLKSMAETDDV